MDYFFSQNTSTNIVTTFVIKIFIYKRVVKKCVTEGTLRNGGDMVLKYKYFYIKNIVFNILIS